MPYDGAYTASYLIWHRHFFFSELLFVFRRAPTWKVAEKGVRRETASAYLKAAGIAVRSPGGWGKRPPAAKPANEVSTDPEPSPSATASVCEPYRNFIELSLSQGSQRQGYLSGSGGRPWLNRPLLQR